MANKNKHFISGYFSSKEVATEAPDQLKQWDKANDDVKLGGMGILDRDSDPYGQGATAGGYHLTTLASDSLPDAFRTVTC